MKTNGNDAQSSIRPREEAGMATPHDGGRRPTEPAPPFLPLTDYALIGNLRTAALVSRGGSIDWCCLPNFDSPAVFCRLLDDRIGGFFRVAPAVPAEVSRHYVDAAPVLETVFASATGRLRLLDFMPAHDLTASHPMAGDEHCHRLARCVECIDGEVEVRVEFVPGFDFSRAPARWSTSAEGLRADGPGQCLLLRGAPELRFEIRDGRATATRTLRAGDGFDLLLSYSDAGTGGRSHEGVDIKSLRDEILHHWRAWRALGTYRGAYAEQVQTSALVLKLLTFAPTGAIVAAPTTSLPERPGGCRNWDYRFCWLRDSALMLEALMSLGFHRAADDFFRWLAEACRQDEARPQIMYRLDAGKPAEEQPLHHLRGYLDSRPVRIGNSAASQRQLDVYGHVLDAAWLHFEARQEAPAPALRALLARLADAAAREWRSPDQGLWETRAPPQHHVSSKVMCWVAFDRAVRLSEAGRIDGDGDCWRREREAVRAAILAHGYSPAQQSFTQVFGGTALDASALQMPLTGFLPATDPRVAATTEAIRRELTERGFVRRYRSDDGVPGDEGAFILCTFWMVTNLAMQGRLDEARALFEHVTSFANDVGLLSEEIDPATGQLLGNHPQGYSHLALIRAALAIDAASR